MDAELGPRPYYLIDQMQEDELKRRLLACEGMAMKPQAPSIGHRGALLMFPEQIVESNHAAVRVAGGIRECDVTYIKFKEMLCRHAQNDLHTTTNTLTTVQE